MKCIAKGCNAEATGLSNFCITHLRGKNGPDRPRKMSVLGFALAQKSAPMEPVGKKVAATKPAGVKTLATKPVGKKVAATKPAGVKALATKPVGKKVAATKPAGIKVLATKPVGKKKAAKKT